MIRASFSQSRSPVALGIAAISTLQPPRLLSNDWFEVLPRKFAKHTGIQTRAISERDEIGMAVEATQKLIRETGCDIQDCAGVVFTSPSMIPVRFARKYMGDRQARLEQITRTACRYVEQMKIQPRYFAGTNRYCAGYASALSIVQHKMRPTIELEPNEFILVLNSTRISRITDYSCSETAGLFGDMATATMISRVDSDKYPARFELLDATVEPVQVSRSFFDFSCRDQIPLPAENEGTQLSGKRIVFTLDGMGIADAAARGMANATTKMSEAIGVDPDEVNAIIPHQAGVAIVRLAEMKIREEGYNCEVVNGLTEHAGNVSSASVPFAISEKWDQLDGLVLCPVASVGPPGKPVVFQGCIALRST